MLNTLTNVLQLEPSFFCLFVSWILILSILSSMTGQQNAVLFKYRNYELWAKLKRSAEQFFPNSKQYSFFLKIDLFHLLFLIVYNTLFLHIITYNFIQCL